MYQFKIIFFGGHRYRDQLKRTSVGVLPEETNTKDIDLDCAFTVDVVLCRDLDIQIPEYPILAYVQGSTLSRTLFQQTPSPATHIPIITMPLKRKPPPLPANFTALRHYAHVSHSVAHSRESHFTDISREELLAQQLAHDVKLTNAIMEVRRRIMDEEMALSTVMRSCPLLGCLMLMFSAAPLETWVLRTSPRAGQAAASEAQDPQGCP